MPTGSMVRVLGSSVFLASTEYYDEKGRHIQTLEDNIKSGTDITTRQYHFDGRILSTCNSHTNVSAGYTSFITLDKYIFDNIGRVTSIQKRLGDNPFVTVVSYAYDDLGRLQSKTLSPGYSNSTTSQPNLETLNYSYNIHNQITGINKDYALKTAGVYSKWGHYFGLYLGYDNKDNAFNKPQLDGQVTGQMWSTQGDDAQRKYDYNYDNAYRLINAAFNQQQHPGDGWGNSTMDFSVSGVSGQITYDNNGNLLTMLQKGIIPGQSAPLIIDDLRYTYNSYSNRLQSVADAMTATTLNGLAGDFKKGNTTGNPDYVYDNNGNVVIDLNKNAQSLNNGAANTPGIHYNFLDKPDQIRIVGKGTILIVYDADGEKLQRAFVPEAGGTGTVTTYINQYVYQETATLTTSALPPFSGSGQHLAYINFEEGRIRAMTPTASNNGYDGLSENGNLVLPGAPGGGFSSGAWDYFIRDYQQNVRMILTGNANAQPLILPNVQAPRNGYAYIYLSNRSDQDVFFDNLIITVTAGNLIEENHYYAFGLKIAAISSKKLGDAAEGKLTNPYLYNDKEMLGEDAGLNWYDYGFRNYDPQIGQFMQLDPLTWEYEDLTPYQFAGNDPIANVDLDGMEPENVLSFMKSLGDGVNASFRLIETGSNAGKWAVTWTVGIEAHAMILKAAPVLNTSTKVLQVATKAAKIVANFVPVVSGVMDIHEGLKKGNWWQVGLGVLSIAADVVTLGSSSLIKGAAKTLIKEGAEVLAKDAVEQVVKHEAEAGTKQFVESGAKQIIKKEAGEEAAKKGSQLLLNPGAADLTQQGLEHIVERHWVTSGAKGASKFLKGTTARSLKDMIGTATTKGAFRPNTLGRAGTIAEYNFGKAIGTTSKGLPASNLRVVIGPKGNVITAFPF